MDCTRPIFRPVGILSAPWSNGWRSMSSRSAWFFASVHSLLRPLLRGPPPIGNIGGGVFWWPVFNLLEGRCEVILVNAQHMKAVPGHKTDIQDAQWIADLLRHGLLKASFIPPKPIRDLRDLVRYRKTLVQERAQEVNRLQKVLETANIKLSSVTSDVLGKSGRDMLQALLAGVSDAATLAELARGRLRAKLPQLREALEGRVDATHRLLLRHLLDHISFLEGELEKLF